MNEAELQLGLWAAASLRRKQHILHLAQVPTDAQQIVEPMVVMVGAHHHLYYCLSGEGAQWFSKSTLVLQSNLLEEVNTWTVRGVFQLAKFYGSVLQYGTSQVEDGFHNRFINNIVQGLAGINC